MAFQISVTYRFLLTPFCQQAAGAALERGEGVGKERARVGSGMGRDREDLWGTKAGRRDVDGGAIWMKTGQEGHGKSPIQLGLHLHVALPHDQLYHLNFSGPAIGRSPTLPSSVMHMCWRQSKTPQTGKHFTSPLVPRADTVCTECKAMTQALNKAKETLCTVEGKKLHTSKWKQSPSLRHMLFSSSPDLGIF